MLSFGIISAAPAYDVAVQAEENTAGVVQQSSNVAYSIQDGDCLIRWNAIQNNNDGERQLTVSRQCDKSFESQARYHAAILERINKDIPLRGIKSLGWGSFSYKEDFSWVTTIALASAKSAMYRDYRENYPLAKVNNINQIFVELANQTRAYQPLATLFEDFDFTLILTSVEKVITSKASKLEFYPDLRLHDVDEHARVIYDVGMSYFLLVPVQK